MKHRFGHYFYIATDKKNKKEGRLRMRVSANQQYFYYGVGYHVEFDKWNKEAQMCVANTSHGKHKIHATVINKEIIDLIDLVKSISDLFIIEKKALTIKEFKKRFQKLNQERLGILKPEPVNKEKTVTFYNVFNEFVVEEGRQNNWTESTFKKFQTVKNHLLRFDDKLKFEDLSHSKLNDYKDYLSLERELRDLTVKTQIKFLKWFLRWATTNGYNEKMDFNSYNPKLLGSDTKVIFLSIEEVNHLENLRIPENKQYLNRVRDFFLFQCYTSLRYSDVSNLKRWDIKGDYIELTTQKTFDFLVIHLNKRSKAILDKYKEFNFEKGAALPVISNQKTNVYIKELCKLAGFDELIDKPYFRGGIRHSDIKPKYEWISSHTGRKTFISNALAIGMPVHIVMEFTGHSDYKAMEPYIDVNESTKRKHMELFIEGFEKNTNN